MNQRTMAVIVAPPGVLRQGLRAAVTSVRRLTVDEVDNIAQAMAIKHDPALVLLSVEGPESSHHAAIRSIKSRWPATPCIVLVDTVAQAQTAREEGADMVLVKGVRPAELLAKIEKQLDDYGPAAPEGEKPRTCGAQ